MWHHREKGKNQNKKKQKNTNGYIHAQQQNNDSVGSLTEWSKKKRAQS